MKLYSLLSYTLLYSIVWDNRKPLLCNKKMAMDGYIMDIYIIVITTITSFRSVSHFCLYVGQLAYKGVGHEVTPLQASAKQVGRLPTFSPVFWPQTLQIQQYFWIHFGYISLIRGLPFQPPLQVKRLPPQEQGYVVYIQ
ncbi:Hypothetical_protein [Hexamita inflata]|uniref:Hypothetical_protein n=1 Tax=Hexamita inflata TaxID=28002 RepID=A0AA86NNQ0_9EUKA|nr:Hypothetical protein HINF_LOCUS9785 [Hexamita inflata]CAI9978063.1 Hypothetical protein HINF_LOCUS65708 [Hexamita inflata]